MLLLYSPDDIPYDTHSLSSIYAQYGICPPIFSRAVWTRRKRLTSGSGMLQAESRIVSRQIEEGTRFLGIYFCFCLSFDYCQIRQRNGRRTSFWLCSTQHTFVFSIQVFLDPRYRRKSQWAPSSVTRLYFYYLLVCLLLTRVCNVCM